MVKWMARKKPESRPKRSSALPNFCNSARCRMRAGGARKRLASKRRDAAITREGASSCAKRMKTEAVETARMAMLIVTSRRNGDGGLADKSGSLSDFCYSTAFFMQVG